MLDVDRAIYAAFPPAAIPQPPRKFAYRNSNIQDASPPKANHGDGEHRKVGSFDPYEFIQLVKDNLSVDRVHISLGSLRAAFLSEKDDLEVELSRLMRTMDGEVDLISKSRSPPTTPDASKKCSHCRGLVEHSHLEASCAELLCQRCRRQKKLHSRLSKNVNMSLLESVASDDFSTENNQTSRFRDENDRSGTGVDDSQEIKTSGGNTKFRNRIKAAMDDHHFVDDFR